MRQSSIIIHKGKREEKYEIYIEDYVMSFLKEETGTLDLAEFYFYGFRENDDKRYIIYGAGRDKDVHVFDKYSLLDEIGCRLTQAGPVFLVKEKSGIYEIKGYEIFYQDNKEMQSYLIDRKRESIRDNNVGKADKTAPPKSQHSAISIQLGIMLVALIAIVINSTNSYDKMKQLNQSASEVFFAIENQEAGAVTEADKGRDEIVMERNAVQEDVQPYEPDIDAAVSDSEQEEDVLKLVALENEMQTEGLKDGEKSETEGNTETAEEPAANEPIQQETAEDSDVSETVQQEENSGESADEQEKVEALSRNVARYYEVERGDTLYTISRKIYGDTSYVQRICEVNEISNPDHIRYGQKILLP